MNTYQSHSPRLTNFVAVAPHGLLLRLCLWANLPTFASALYSARPMSALPPRPNSSERGAVSLEQVLWFVAAGLSVAVIAGILWTQIRNQATTPINVPSAP
jgi:hypothetical protein